MKITTNLDNVDFRLDFAASTSASTLIGLAIAEDFETGGDLTARATIPVDAVGTVRFVARSPGVIAGIQVAAMICQRLGIGRGFQPCYTDLRVDAGVVFATATGPMRSLLAMERISLNFLQRLSGIATLTARFVAEVEGTKAVILDTRKTTPGWRALEKYAVRCGGGQNHRMGLYDAVMIKDNHLAWLASDPDPIGRAIASARHETPPGTTVTIEVDNLDQFDRALECAPDVILVDNLGPGLLAEAVRRRNAVAPKRRGSRKPDVLLEASGGVTLATVRALAETGVDRISVGALTHSAPSLDIGLDFDAVLVG